MCGENASGNHGSEVTKQDGRCVVVARLLVFVSSLFVSALSFAQQHFDPSADYKHGPDLTFPGVIVIAIFLVVPFIFFKFLPNGVSSKVKYSLTVATYIATLLVTGLISSDQVMELWKGLKIG